ncbi:MAG: hypothetical protein ACLQME_08115 [Alphaproteobacteria bacterium]
MIVGDIAVIAGPECCAFAQDAQARRPMLKGALDVLGLGEIGIVAVEIGDEYGESRFGRSPCRLRLDQTKQAPRMNILQKPAKSRSAP